MTYIITLYFLIGLYESFRQYRNTIENKKSFLNCHWGFELFALLIYACIAPIIMLGILISLLYTNIVYGEYK